MRSKEVENKLNQVSIVQDEEEKLPKVDENVAANINESDWSDIDDSDISEKVGVINSFPVEEEKKGEFPDDGVEVNDSRPEWMKFLI